MVPVVSLKKINLPSVSITLLVYVQAMTQADEVWLMQLRGLYCLHSPGVLSETNEGWHTLCTLSVRNSQ